MARRISWTNNSSGHSGTYVYRAPSLDPQNLPAPVATVDPVAQGATAEWIDSTTTDSQCYAVRDFEGGEVGPISDSNCIAVTISGRYWRLNITSGKDGSDDVQIYEVEYREAQGGVNLATGGVASASQSYSSSFNGPKAFDGSVSSSWYSQDGIPKWLKYDFGVSISPIELAIYCTTAHRVPESFDIQCSDDDSTWTTVASFSGLDWAGYMDVYRIFQVQ